jgi:hypothetical protein
VPLSCKQKGVEKMNIRAVKMKHEEQLMRLSNVMGVSISEKGGKEVIKVFVTHKIPKSSLRPQDIIPETLEGFEVDVEELGSLTTQT